MLPCVGILWKTAGWTKYLTISSLPKQQFHICSNTHISCAEVRCLFAVPGFFYPKWWFLLSRLFQPFPNLCLHSCSLFLCIFIAFLVWVQDSSPSCRFSFSPPKDKQSIGGLCITDIAPLPLLSQGSCSWETEGGGILSFLNSGNYLQLLIFFSPCPYLQLRFSISFLGSEDVESEMVLGYLGIQLQLLPGKRSKQWELPVGEWWSFLFLALLIVGGARPRAEAICLAPLLIWLFHEECGFTYATFTDFCTMGKNEKNGHKHI